MNLARSTSIIALMVPPVRPGHGVSVDVDRPQVPVRAWDIDNYELRALDALDAHIPVCENAGIQLVGAVGRVPEVVEHLVRIR